MKSFSETRTLLLERTKKQIAEAVGPDILIIQTLNTLDDLTIQLNGLSKRLREWYSYTLPELDRGLSDNEAYSRLIATKSYDELVKEFVGDATPMGAPLNEADYIAVQSLARQIAELFQFRQSLLHYLESRMQQLAPNVTALAGTTISARLLASAGSLRRLAMMPASTIQLLGAEKALFRHLKTGAKSPKHGFIINHPLLQKAKKSMRGKIARALGDKIALCAKVDFFKGDFVADEILNKLETRFSQ